MREDTVVTGAGSWPSAFAVSDLAVESIARAGEAMADLVALDRRRPCVTVDRVLASWWFAMSLRPIGWALPPMWDPLAGDYRAADGWIRLHTNAPQHRSAALEALEALGSSDRHATDRADVTALVARWRADDLEDAVVRCGGAAAAMRSLADWRAHPQGVAVASEPLVSMAAGTPGRVPPPGPADRPLAGLRVLDLTRVLAGPVATRFLAGFGADVLRVDPPAWDEPAVVPEVTLGKRCARLDGTTTAGRRAVVDLLRDADVLVHGYRPGAIDALVGDASRRAELRPGLVEVSLDAYGWTGPWAGRRGFDSLVQMSTGIAQAGAAWKGLASPHPLPVQALDHATGYLMAGAVADLVRLRRETGLGGSARCSLARTAAWLIELGGGATGPLPERTAQDEVPEPTPWGPAHRLRPPLTVDGTPMRWDRHSTALGSHPAAW